MAGKTLEEELDCFYCGSSTAAACGDCGAVRTCSQAHLRLHKGGDGSKERKFNVIKFNEKI